MSLENVKVGDKLYTKKWGVPSTYTVKRITKTQAICEGGIVFMIKTGHMVRGNSCAQILTVEMKASIEMEVRLRVARAKLQIVKVTSKNIDATEVYLNMVADPEPPRKDE